MTTLALNFPWILFILAGNKVNHKSLDGFEFQHDSELAALEPLKNQ